MCKLQFVQDGAKVRLDAANHVRAKKAAATVGETGETAVSADAVDAVTDIQDPAGTIMIPAPFEQSAGQKKRKANRAKANCAKVTQSSTTSRPPIFNASAGTPSASNHSTQGQGLQMPAPLAPTSAQAQSSNHMRQPQVTFSHPHMSRQITYAEPFTLPPPQAQAWSPTHTQQPVTFRHPHMSRQITYAESFSLPSLQVQAWSPTHTPQPVTFSHPYMTQQRTYAKSFPQQVMDIAGFQSQMPFTEAMARPSLTVDNTMTTSQAQSEHSAFQFVNRTASDYFMKQ
ncbi:hypothetical protein F5887DRAFT_1089405 [Amanita rubescens]|nr:hypothetical protein F5887DRAFT_1089405 [Amanita rubescens]